MSRAEINRFIFQNINTSTKDESVIIRACVVAVFRRRMDDNTAAI